MTARMTPAATDTIEVGPDDTLVDVLDRIRAGGQAPLVLVIPGQSGLFLTAAEFRTLHAVAEHGRHAVTVRTADPHRVQLARLLGFDVDVVAPPAPKPAPPPVVAPPLAPEPEPDVESSISADDAVAVWPEAVEHQPVPGLAQRWRDRLSARLAARPAPAAPPLESAPASDEDALAAIPATLDDEAAAGPIHWPGVRRRPRPIVVTGAVALAVLLWFGLNYLVPTATVKLRLAAMPINSSLVFDVTATGEPRDDEAAIALKGTPRQVSVTYEGTLPTTGRRAEPDAVASGTVRFANPTAGDITIDVGTVLVSASGAEFTVVEPVTVPGLDPATQRPGQADGAVRAATGGTSGNVGVGEIGGKLPNGVFYSNREQPTTGGTDREIAVVSEADQATLMAQAEEATLELVAAAVATADPTQAIVPPTLVVDARSNAFDQEVGAAANFLALSSEIAVTVLTYDEAAASNAIAEHLGEQLAATVPPGYRLGPVALDADDFTVIGGDATGGRFAVDAAARADLAMRPEQERELANQLAGKSPQEAAALLAAAPEIVEHEIVPGFRFFWSDTLPANPDRISFDVSGD